MTKVRVTAIVELDFEVQTYHIDNIMFGGAEIKASDIFNELKSVSEFRIDGFEIIEK